MSDALDNPFVFSLHRGAKVPLRKQTIKHRDHQIYGKGRDAAPEAAAGEAAAGEASHNAGAAGAHSEVTPKTKTEALP